MAELIHALNRGVDKRKIFMNDHDHLRFIYGLFIFNDNRPVDIASLKAKGLTMSFSDSSETKKRERIVDIHGWCLMGNHYHLLLSELVEGGISLFLKKLNIGYAKYFNDCHRRSGTLFQGRTKQIRIETDQQFLHILNYIHLNPLDILNGCSDWREHKIRGTRTAMKHLEQYRWSSFNDYCGRKNFPAVITTDLFLDVFKDYQHEIRSYLSDIDLAPLKDLPIE